MKSPYDLLLKKIREIADLRYAEAVLSWDQQTYMPPKGNDARARQMALLSGLAHERICHPEFGDALAASIAEPNLTDEQKALLREAKRDRDKAVKVPNDLVREISETAGKAHIQWAHARRDNRFETFAPWLRRLVDLKTREAQALGYPPGGVPYDALLDNFEPGATVKELNPIIKRTRDMVVAAAHSITRAPRQPREEILKRFFAEKGQERIGQIVIKQMGYDLEAGRLDCSVHPFTTNFDIQDVRITTRYEEHWLPGSLFGTIHECGHALYEQGMPLEHSGTPLAEAVSLGLHESQSRLWENQIGRSLPFWTYLYPKLRETFPEPLKDVSLEEFHFAINQVKPSLIRVEADEATYNLHIVVRYEIEQALFNNEVKVEELPALWNDKMQTYLGIRPETDALGVLQDIHWSFGGFGYFPTYLLGNLYAAQWMAALRGEMPDLDDRIARGEWLPIREWLREKIHRQGRRYSAAELAVRVSGEKLNPDHFGRYLKEKFGPLYGVAW